MSDLNKIVDELSKLSVIEAAELSKLLQEKWGVSAAAPVAVAAAGGEATGGEKATEKVYDDIGRVRKKFRNQKTEIRNQNETAENRNQNETAVSFL